MGNLNGAVCREKRGRDESISGRGRRTVSAAERAVFVPVFVMDAWIDSTGFMSGPQRRWELGAMNHGVELGHISTSAAGESSAPGTLPP